MEPRVRKMKISYTRNPRIAYSPTGCRGTDYYSVPYIRLRGEWLRKLGFVEGAGITVWVKKKKLIITVDKRYRFK